ncbi:MAG: hypothetical protein ACLRVT_03155 [Oscillospiraceae bacterium]
MCCTAICPEITTYRTESGYTDHRYPDEVSFTKSLRRIFPADFTINAMAYHPKLGCGITLGP